MGDDGDLMGVVFGWIVVVGGVVGWIVGVGEGG